MPNIDCPQVELDHGQVGLLMSNVNKQAKNSSEAGIAPKHEYRGERVL